MRKRYINWCEKVTSKLFLETVTNFCVFEIKGAREAFIFESFPKTLRKWLCIVLLLLYCGVYDGIFNLVRNYI